MRSRFKAFIHPFRAPISWGLQAGLLPGSLLRQVLPWSWGVEPFTIHADGFKVKYFPSEVDTVGQRVFWTGFREWEKDSVPVFVQLLRESKCFIDIGANCGIYPVLGCAINPHLKVVAVEPVPRIHAALANNVRQSNLGSRVTLIQAAVATQEGTAHFHESADPTMGSLSPEGYRGKPGKVIEVKTTTLDTIVSKLPIPPDFIKIDVEGFEDVVLEGGPQTLSVHRPRFIVEANLDGPHQKLTQIFQSYGYTFYHLTESGLVKKDIIQPSGSESDQEDCRNWLCLPPGGHPPKL